MKSQSQSQNSSSDSSDSDEELDTNVTSAVSYDYDGTLNCNGFEELFFSLLYFAEAKKIPQFISTNRSINESLGHFRDHLERAIKSNSAIDLNVLEKDTLRYGVQELNNHGIRIHISTSLQCFYDKSDEPHFIQILRVETAFLAFIKKYQSTIKTQDDINSLFDVFMKEPETAALINKENTYDQRLTQKYGYSSLWKQQIFRYNKQIVGKPLHLVHFDDDPVKELPRLKPTRYIVEYIKRDEKLNSQKLKVTPIHFDSWEQNSHTKNNNFRNAIQQGAAHIGLEDYAKKLLKEQELTDDCLADFAAMLYIIRIEEYDENIRDLINKFYHSHYCNLNKFQQDLFDTTVKYFDKKEKSVIAYNQLLLDLESNKKINPNSLLDFKNKHWNHLSVKQQVNLGVYLDIRNIIAGSFNDGPTRMFKVFVSNHPRKPDYQTCLDCLPISDRPLFEKFVVRYDATNLLNENEFSGNAVRDFHAMRYLAKKGALQENQLRQFYQTSYPRLSLYDKTVCNDFVRTLQTPANNVNKLSEDQKATPPKACTEVLRIAEKQVFQRQPWYKRIMQRWEAMPYPRATSALAVTLTCAGIATALLSVLFPPVLALTMLLIGTVFATTTAALHTADVLTTPVPLTGENVLYGPVGRDKTSGPKNINVLMSTAKVATLMEDAISTSIDGAPVNDLSATGNNSAEVTRVAPVVDLSAAGNNSSNVINVASVIDLSATGNNSPEVTNVIKEQKRSRSC